MPRQPSADAQYASTWRQVSVTAGALTPVVAANPLRVALLFAGSAGTLTLNTDPTLLKPSTIGMLLPTTGYLEFVWERHGPLVQAAWYCVSGTTGVLSFVEVAAVPGG